METNGRRKCEILKELRKHIAQENGITYAPAECNFEGECPGTCPKCEAELQYLQSEIDKKKGGSCTLRHAAAATIGGLLASAMISCNSTSGDEDLQVMGESLPVVVIDSSMVGQKHEVLYTIEGEDSVTTDSV
ncbi:MAG: hypothetical protein KBT10_05930, partial [Bacteroidales bacterium]|nr:hypothetical protein [Candidatus Sodaliphilus aphodohippi]